MSNPWLKHVAEFRANHKDMDYKKVLTEARKTYTPLTTTKTKAKTKPKSKSKSQKGGQYVLGSKVAVKPQKGGNPALLAALPAVAEAGKAIQGTFQAGINAVDNQLDRGFQKKQLTGAYDRAKDHNDRAAMARNYKFAQKMVKKYGGDISQYLPK